MIISLNNENKEESSVIEEIWEQAYLQIRNKIWLVRCEEVLEIEKSMGISK